MAPPQTPLIYKSLNDPLARLYVWQFGDESLLADYVARLLLGQHRHVRNIMEGTVGAIPSFSEQMLQTTLGNLRANSDAERFQRDGWLFQLIAWIGLRLVEKQYALVSPPHSRPADKGFDALAITLDGTTMRPVSLMICEEKATDEPRKKFQQQVLPDFRNCCAGLRDTEIKAELTTLLASSNIKEDEIEEFLNIVMWERKREYRVSLTISDANDEKYKPGKLLKGFDKTIIGDSSLRRAELFQIPELRTWMEEFSQRVCSRLEELEGRICMTTNPNV